MRHSSVVPVIPVVDPLQGRAVLVTGGTGTFGQAFARRALAAGARKVVIVSRGEAKQAAMKAALPDERLRFLIGDVRDARRMAEAFRGIDVVVHAAALKRVETCEADPDEAIATNVLGTQHVARACIERGVQRAVFLSTDKAAAPNTLYGHTKATAERAWVAANVYAAGTPTRFAATRYGNVIGSTGSVLPLWRDQKARGVPLTLTDERATRFWMTIADAVDLVLLALREMRGGEVFVPKCKAAPILDLARAVAETEVVTAPLGERVTFPYAPGHICTGLRRGEKLHELLVSEDEAQDVLDHGTYFVIDPDRTWENGPHPRWTYTAADDGPVGAYRSDAAPRWTVEELRRMIG